jgi:hypothetical protein
MGVMDILRGRATGRLIEQVDSFAWDDDGRINFRRPDEIERRNVWGVELLQLFLVHAADGEFVFGMPVSGWLSGERGRNHQNLLHGLEGSPSPCLLWAQDRVSGGNRPAAIFILSSFDSVNVEC